MHDKPSRRRYLSFILASLGVTTILLTATTVPARAAIGPTYVNWPAYLDGATHQSDNSAAMAITQSNATTLTEAWNFKPGAPPVRKLGYALDASPTVYDGVVYIGGNNGTFYALNESTGATIWTALIGYVNPKSGCGPRGITSTATVATDPTTGVLTVYVSGGSGYLYALNADTGAVIWRSVIHTQVGNAGNYYDWASPTVVNDRIYVGISGSCITHVRGGMLEFNQTTGKRLEAYYTVPAGEVGGSVWSSAAVANDGNVFVGTGNDLSPTPSNAGTSESIVELNGKSLAQVGVWQLPLTDQPDDDSDFGASVSLFSAVLPGTTKPTPLVGGCNKNGMYYLLKQDDLAAGPVWSTRIAAVNPGSDGMAAACLSSTVVNGDNLYVAGTATTINGTSYDGSITDLNAATGAVIWATGLPAPVLATPSLDGSGVLAVGTIGSGSEPNADYLLNPSTGAILTTISNGNSPQIAQPVFADGYLLIATQTTGLYAYELHQS
jgi:polyvinyl alcohol dehydrogenase (cytochrome)